MEGGIRIIAEGVRFGPEWRKNAPLDFDPQAFDRALKMVLEILCPLYAEVFGVPAKDDAKPR